MPTSPCAYPRPDVMPVKMKQMVISINTLEIANHRFKIEHNSLLRYVLDCLTTEFPRVANVVNVSLRWNKKYRKKSIDSKCTKKPDWSKWNIEKKNQFHWNTDSFRLFCSSGCRWPWSSPIGFIRLKSK